MAKLQLSNFLWTDFNGTHDLRQKKIRFHFFKKYILTSAEMLPEVLVSILLTFKVLELFVISNRDFLKGSFS